MTVFFGEVSKKAITADPVGTSGLLLYFVVAHITEELSNLQGAKKALVMFTLAFTALAFCSVDCNS